ncbi:MAG: hypothetical protein GKR94_09345 [Gammaproteobacteria bacterium]|nr:hypothetical protein [Gammaproteobacteria bacterium]
MLAIQFGSDLRAPLKMHFFRDCSVSSVLESSGITYTLRFCARCFLALTKKLLFLETPLITGITFFLTIPVLVSFLTLTSMRVLTLVDLSNRLLGVSLLGLAVLLPVSVIMMLGILATASFQRLTGHRAGVVGNERPMRMASD